MTEMESHKKPIAAIDRLAARVASWLIRSRKSLSVLFVLVSVLLGVAALDVQGDPGFNKLIPISHEYMQAFLNTGRLVLGRESHPRQRALEGRR